MSSSPVIPWTTRADLSTIDLGGECGRSFAVKDKVSNEFFRFDELQHYILRLLQRDSVTLSGLQAGIRTEFGLTVSDQEIAAYLNHLASDNLLVAKRLGDGGRLFRQHARLNSSGRRQQILGLLSIKLPGFYPSPMLSLLQPIGKLVFNPISVAVLSLLIVLTFGYAALSFQTVFEKAPAFSQLLSVEHLVLMTVGFVIAKIIHEIGHGLACRQMGYECSEMGVLLLVMIPCLYCDVSDMWAAKSRYKRMLVSLAGVFVELIIAAVCFWGWYYSLDGMLHRFLFGMMLVTSLNTIFVNGNPLMRYDGYYALSDWVGVPNLSAVSQACLNRQVDDFFYSKEQSVTLHQRTGWLSLFALASTVYRWLILFAIGWAAWTFFENQQLLSLGRVVVACLVILAVLPFAFFIKRHFKNAWDHGFRWANALAFLTFVGALIYGGCQIEFFQRVSGIAEIQLANARPVFATESGRITPVSYDGQFVEQGDTIATIENEDLVLEAMLTQQQIDDAKIKLSSLKLTDQTQEVAAQIEFWLKRKGSWERKLEGIRERQSDLVVVSPISGRLVVRTYDRIPQQQANEQLLVRDGEWTDAAHRGSHVKRGARLGYVGDPEVCRGIMNVSEHDIELVKTGQSVKLHLPCNDEFITGTITRISLENQPDRQNLPADAQAIDQSSAFYQIEFQFSKDDRVRIGAARKAVVLCRRTTFFDWATRWVYHSFWL